MQKYKMQLIHIHGPRGRKKCIQTLMCVLYSRTATKVQRGKKHLVAQIFPHFFTETRGLIEHHQANLQLQFSLNLY